MDVNRRNLMKGVLTGGTLLALGIPPGAFASAPAGRTGRFGLLL
ncbi:MAG: twin-arginine translocation signal domain-containing protein [Nitrosospira sp.]